MTLPDSPPDREPDDHSYRRATLWLTGVTAVAGLIGALAALVSAFRG